jgi:hypothetical protein
MLIDDRAALYLKLFSDGGEFPGGLAFRTALKQSRLDYSIESLERIDHLLDEIRGRFKLEQDRFLENTSNQTFLYLVAFYVGNVVARVSKLPVRWLVYADLIALYPLAKAEFPESFATSVSCELGGGGLFLPLVSVVRRIFEPESGSGVRESAGRFIVNQDAMLAFRQPLKYSFSSTPPALQPLVSAMYLAGLVSVLMVAAAAVGGLVPMFGTLFNGESVLTKMEYGSVEEAVKTGLERLKTNPDGAQQQVFAYDGFVRLASGRTEAVVVEVRANSTPPFLASLVVPYRVASHADGFAVYRIKLMSSNADDELQTLLMDHFYAGVHEVQQGVRVWRKYLDERV